MKRYDVINQLIKERGYTSYLEIGVSTGKNFNRIKCDEKIGVEPTRDGVDSDKFFESNEQKFDIIFIDGLHTAEQVEKDIINSWNSLNPKGIIILHDVNPKTKESQLVPKVSIPWKGDVWRAFYGFMKAYPKINSYYTDQDTGLGFIEKSRHKVSEGFIESEMTYEEFDKLRYS